MSNLTAIILATYNGEKWLVDQVQSLLAQTHENWRLYISDDCSVDRTVEIAERFAAIDPRIQVLPRPASRRGSATANFLSTLWLIRETEFDFVSFCDQDDIWAPGKLQRAIDAIRQSGVEGYSCDLVTFDNDQKSAVYIAKGGARLAHDYLFQGASAGCTYVLTRKAADLVNRQTGLRDSSEWLDRSHDWLIYAICRSEGFDWLHDDAAHIFYRQHSHNVYGAMRQWSGFAKKLAIARSGWYRQHVLWNQSFLKPDPAQKEILSRLARYRLADRVWLALRVRQFRRNSKQALGLAVLLLLGWM